MSNLPATTHPASTNAPATLPEPQTLTPERLRAWAWHRQGLDGSLAGRTAEQVFARAGWARSVGGANPYLTLFARAGIRREQVDADVLAHRILELPAARGCTYVLGRDDFAWALQLGRDAADSAFRVVGRLGVDRGEITLLEEQVIHTLAEAEGPMDPRQLKDELGDSVRNLGEEGKKKGATTTLPTALGILQSDGRIRRVPANGRLDQQRYAYEPWGLPPSGLDDGDARTELIRRYLGWTGGATFKQSQWFTAFTVAQTKAALAAVGAVEVPTAQSAGGGEAQTAAGGDALWMLPDDVGRLAAFEEPAGGTDPAARRHGFAVPAAPERGGPARRGRPGQAGAGVARAAGGSPGPPHPGPRQDHRALAVRTGQGADRALAVPRPHARRDAADRRGGGLDPRGPW